MKRIRLSILFFIIISTTSATELVGIVNLLNDIEKYNDKLISVVGYVNDENGKFVLYLNKGYADSSINTPEKLVLVFEQKPNIKKIDEDCFNSYLKVVGRVEMDVFYKIKVIDDLTYLSKNRGVVKACGFMGDKVLDSNYDLFGSSVES